LEVLEELEQAEQLVLEDRAVAVVTKLEAVEEIKVDIHHLKEILEQRDNYLVAVMLEAEAVEVLHQVEVLLMEEQEVNGLMEHITLEEAEQVELVAEEGQEELVVEDQEEDQEHREQQEQLTLVVEAVEAVELELLADLE
jgi:hypothetical protein